MIIVAFMFILPMGFEIFSEQSKILAKIQMQMMNESMMGGMGGADMQPQIRPFWKSNSKDDKINHKYKCMFYILL